MFGRDRLSLTMGIMRTTTEQFMRELEERAKRLASRNCFYLAATLLEHYDGEHADETKNARLTAARRYLELARNQSSCTP
jgi:hypothetical protein